MKIAMKTGVLAVATLIAGASAAYAQGSSPAQNKLIAESRAHHERQATQDAAFLQHQQREHELAEKARASGDTKTLDYIAKQRAADAQHLDRLHAQKAADAEHVKRLYNKTN